MQYHHSDSCDVPVPCTLVCLKKNCGSYQVCHGSIVSILVLYDVVRYPFDLPGFSLSKIGPYDFARALICFVKLESKFRIKLLTCVCELLCIQKTTSKRMVGIKRVFQFVSFYLLTGVPHLHKCGIPGTMAWLSSGEILYPIRSHHYQYLCLASNIYGYG